MGKIIEENEYVKNVREELKPELSKLSKGKVLDFSFSYEISKFLYEYMEKNVYGKYGSSPDEMVKFLDACIYILESSEMQKYLENDSYVFLDIFEEKEKALYEVLQQNSEYKNIISTKPLKTSPFPLSQFYCMRGFVLSRSGKENKAMESYKNALKYNFLAETINYYYCEGCIISNKFELLEEGLKKFYEVAHTEKQIFLYYVLLGEWYVYRQEFDKALASYTIASQISSEHMPGTGINTIIEKYGDCWSDKLKNDMNKLSFDYFGRNLISKSAVTVLLNCADELCNTGHYDSAISYYEFVDGYVNDSSIKKRIKKCNDKHALEMEKHNASEKWGIIVNNVMEGKPLGKCPYCNEETLKVSRSNLGEEIHATWMERYINTIWCEKCERGVWSADSKSDLKMPNIPIPSDLTLEIHFDF